MPETGFDMHASSLTALMPTETCYHYYITHHRIFI